MISYPSSIDYSTYEKQNDLEIKYGLPREVIYCKRCVISDQRPNSSNEYTHQSNSKKETILFDEQGICDACRFSEKKQKEINWSEREQQLLELCNQYRRTDGGYDCLLPGSGGKDSFYAAHILKYKYGMHPLTVTWAPNLYTDWGWKNHRAWINAGFDNYLITPNAKTHRLLTRLAVDNLLHPFQPFIIGQKAIPPKIAAQLNIPLLFYGENEAEYGNPIRDTEKSIRDYRYFTQHTDNVFLSGVSITELFESFGLSKNDLNIYMPTSPEQLEDKNIKVHYLGYYLKWHPQSCYYYAVENGGFTASPERTLGTYSKYNSIDDKIDDLHYYTTGVKFGIGRATYDAAQEIRSGDITRDEGIALVKRYDHEYPTRFLDDIFHYLSINKKEFPMASQHFEKPEMDNEYFNRLCDHFRSAHLWKWEGQWVLRHPILDISEDDVLVTSLVEEYLR